MWGRGRTTERPLTEDIQRLIYEACVLENLMIWTWTRSWFISGIRYSKWEWRRDVLAFVNVGGGDCPTAQSWVSETAALILPTGQFMILSQRKPSRSPQLSLCRFTPPTWPELPVSFSLSLPARSTIVTRPFIMYCLRTNRAM